MSDELQKEVLRKLAEKSELEQTFAVGFQGAPELKAEEKSHFLGQFRERVLRILTKRQVIERLVYPEIEQAMLDPRSAIMLIHGGIDIKHRIKYQKLASKLGKPYTIVHDPNLRGDVGLVVAGETAVEVEFITVDAK